jgi:hypothetical protein
MLLDLRTPIKHAPLEIPISAPHLGGLAGKRVIYELRANDAMHEVQDQ